MQEIVVKMNVDHEFELNELIKDLEKETERYPGIGVSNYDFLRLVYFLKAALAASGNPPSSETSTTAPP